MRPLLLLLALACACKSPPAQEPAVPLPTDVATLPVFDPAALGPAAPRWATPPVPLVVVDYVPHHWAVDFRFNQPVATQDLATPDPAPLLRFDPPVRGSASWVAPDHLRYTFDGAPPDATRYRVHLASDLRGQDGQPLADTRAWTFETDRPRISDVDRDIRDELPVDAPVILAFDHPVDLASLSAHLTAHAHAPPDAPPSDDWELRDVPRARKTPGAPVPISVRVATKRDLLAADSSRDPAPELYTVRPATRWPASKEIELILRPGLVGTVGPLPTDTPWATRFTTPRPQALESSSCTREAPCGLDEPLVLRFRNEVRYYDLERVTLSPRPDWLNYNNHDPDEHSYEWRGRFKPGVYTVRIPPGLKDIHGQPAPPTTRQVWFVQKPDLTLSAATGVLPPSRPHVGVEAHMLRSVRVQIGVYDERELAVIEQLGDLPEASLARLALPARTRTLEVQLTPQGATKWAAHALDLAALTAPLRPPSTPLHGAVLVEVTPLATTAGTHRPDPVRGLYRVTDLSLVAHASPGATVVRAFHLSSGTPAPGVAVCRTGPDPKDSTCHPLGTTDQDGLLRASVPRPKFRPWSEDDDRPDAPPREHVRLVGSLAADRTYLDIEPASGPTWWQAPRADNPRLRPGEHLRAELVRERGAYRPGERVHLVGWAALDTPHTPHNLAPLTRGTPVTLTLMDRRDVVARATARTSAAGKFSASLDLPATASLGYYTAVAELAGEPIRTHFEVQDYRTPEFAVTATPRRSELLVDERAEVDVRAAYFFGAPVAISEVTWRPSCQPIRYTPPNLEPGWTVGPVHLPHSQQHRASSTVPAAAGDPPGQRTLAAKLPVDSPITPQSCQISVYAQDASAQGVGAETRVTLHPADIYVAMHTPAVAHPGDRVRVALRALTRDGDRVADHATVHIKRAWDEPIYSEEDGLRWQSGATRHAEELPPCSVDLPAAGPDAACELPAGPVDSIYELTAVATRDGRRAESSAELRVIPRPEQRPVQPLRRSKPIDLELHPDRTSVRPGERLEVVVRGPWSGARGQLVTARRGVHEVHPFTLKNQQATITLTADDTWTPSLELVAHVFAPEGKHASLRRRTVAAKILQSGDHRRLQVAISAPREAGPGDRLPVTITVRDPNDRPVAGRVAVWAVDEAVLSLTDERLPDLLPGFLPAATREVDDHDVLAHILAPYVPSTIDPDQRRPMFRSRRTRAPAVRSGAAQVNPGPPGPARSRFETTPLFLGDAPVDATGTARVTATLPDNLTTFRITAIASADLVGTTTPGRFGGAEARVLVTSPLVVRAVAPRQLRPGDIAELAALVDNRTAEPGTVQVSASLISKPTGPRAPVLEFMSETTGRARVPAHGQVRVPFKIRALSAGTIDVKLSADLSAARTSSDALQISLPVAAEPTLIDRVAIHGELAANGAVQIPIKIPQGALPGHGGLDLRASTSLVAGLDDAARALVDYPYGCLEQTASRLVPLIALQDLELATPPDYLEATLERLATMQTNRGGFAYWPGEDRVHLYASAYTTWLLQRAASAGLHVPKDMLSRALANLERRLVDLDFTSLPPSVQVDLGVTLAPALHALADAGKDIDAAAALLFERRARLPLFTRATLLLALHRRDPADPAARTLADELLANLSHGPDGAHAVELLPHGMDEHFHSDARSDAMVLLALLSARPDAPALADLVRGLQSRRPAGAWRNTQENAWAILALAAWARVREPATPDIHARVWLAGQPALDAALRGRDAATTLHAPMSDLLARTTTDDLLPLVLQRQGTGPLHYRLALDWAPGGDPPARDRGLAISRHIRQGDEPLAADDFIAVGNAVAVDLELRTHQRVRYVAVDVPIPAGLEPVQLTLGKGQTAATGTGTTGRWFTRQELRRDRVLLFIDDLPPGLHRHTIHLRATSRGHYTFPPAHAEAMYIPELQGRSRATKLEVR